MTLKLTANLICLNLRANLSARRENLASVDLISLKFAKFKPHNKPLKKRAYCAFKA